MSFTPLDNTIHRISDFAPIVNENFRLIGAGVVNLVAQAGAFTIWTDDAEGSPKTHYACNGTFAATLVSATETDAAAGRTVWIKNEGAGVITVTPDGSDTIEGSATLMLAAGDAATLLSDGTSNWGIW